MSFDHRFLTDWSLTLLSIKMLNFRFQFSIFSLAFENSIEFIENYNSLVLQIVFPICSMLKSRVTGRHKNCLILTSNVLLYLFEYLNSNIERKKILNKMQKIIKNNNQSYFQTLEIFFVCFKCTFKLRENIFLSNLYFLI